MEHPLVRCRFMYVQAVELWLYWPYTGSAPVNGVWLRVRYAVCGVRYRERRNSIEIEVSGTNDTSPMFGRLLLKRCCWQRYLPHVRAEGETGDARADAGNAEAVDKALERLVTATQKVLMVYNRDLEWQK